MKKLILFALLSGFVSLSAMAASLENQTFEEVAQLVNKDLQLNGLGVRSVLFFKVYVAGLYLIDKSKNSQDVLSNGEPKRLQLQMLRDVDAADIKKALIDGMRERCSESQWIALKARASQLARTIDMIGRSKKGDTIALDFVPDRGMTLTYNHVIQGNSIHGQDFYNAILSIFIGERPVDASLKQGLMGLAR